MSAVKGSLARSRKSAVLALSQARTHAAAGGDSAQHALGASPFPLREAADTAQIKDGCGIKPPHSLRCSRLLAAPESDPAAYLDADDHSSRLLRRRYVAKAPTVKRNPNASPRSCFHPRASLTPEVPTASTSTANAANALRTNAARSKRNQAPRNISRQPSHNPTVPRAADSDNRVIAAESQSRETSANVSPAPTTTPRLLAIENARPRRATCAPASMRSAQSRQYARTSGLAPS